MFTHNYRYLVYKICLLILCLSGSLPMQSQSKRFQFQSVTYPVFDEYTHETLFGVQVLCYAEGDYPPILYGQ